ncbi:MFS transporter [Hamadaea sp. NPDC051192]|uniref:MFS transporter n=1 Tax=Hamadaea sp. NPDC051192 TaxID=3154940 RepID=UPI00341A2A26
MTTTGLRTNSSESELMETGSAQEGIRGAVGALREPAFRWWFFSQVLSASGGMTQAVALSWLVLHLTARPVDLGVLGAITWAPVLFGGAYAGAVLDRVDTRRTLIVTQAAYVVLGITQAVLVATGSMQIWSLYATAVLTGVVTAFDGPARQVYVLEIVGRQRLVSAVSLHEVVLNSSRVIGPAVGGLILATAGLAWCFVLNAATFVPVLLVLTLARRRARDTVDRTVPSRRGGGAKEGIRQVWRTPVVRSCVLVAIAGGTLFNLGVALPVLVTDTFHLGGAGFGLMMAAFGLGAIPGALVAAGTSGPSGRRVRVLAVLSGVTVLLTAASPLAALAFVGIAVAGFLSIWLISVANTLVQLRADPALRGRIMGVWTMALPGTVPFTGLLSAAVSQGLGARAGFGFAGVVLTGVAMVTWRALGDRPIV